MKTIFTLTISALFALFLIACQNNSAANNSANQNVNKTTNTSSNTQLANKPETNTTANTATNTATNAEPKAEMSDKPISASTPTEAYKSLYAARKNKDIAALKKLIAKDMFEFFEILGEGKENPLEAGLKEMCEQPQGPSDDSRDEKITGDKATLQILDKDKKWITTDFVKEDGVWKMTIAKMDNDKKAK